MNCETVRTFLALSLIVAGFLTLINLGLVALSFKLYTEFVKERLQKRRRTSPPPINGGP